MPISCMICPMMMNFLLIGLGGALGSILRYGVGLLSLRLLGNAFPWGTLGVNLAGSLAIGLVFAFLSHLQNWSDEIRLFAIGGVLGGFTTFSAFSLDAVLLFEKGQTLSALAYITTSVLFSILATCLGLYLVRIFTA